MNAKKYLVVAMVLNTVLLAFAVSWSHRVTSETSPAANDPMRTALTGLREKLGPMVETVLPAQKDGIPPAILDLETGRALAEPPFEYFSSRVDAIMAWPRANGVD